MLSSIDLFYVVTSIRIFHLSNISDTFYQQPVKLYIYVCIYIHIYIYMWKYFQDIDNTSRSNPRKFWPELTSATPKIYEKSIPKIMTANEFNIFFKSVPDKVSAVCDKGKPLLWKSAQSVHTFKFHEISRNDVLKLLYSLYDKINLYADDTRHASWISGKSRISWHVHTFWYILGFSYSKSL